MITISLNDVSVQHAVLSLETLPLVRNKARDVRFVKEANQFYIWNTSSASGTAVNWVPAILTK